jgi:hypothetical protein
VESLRPSRNIRGYYVDQATATSCSIALQILCPLPKAVYLWLLQVFGSHQRNGSEYRDACQHGETHGSKCRDACQHGETHGLECRDACHHGETRGSECSDAFQHEETHGSECRDACQHGKLSSR